MMPIRSRPSSAPRMRPASELLIAVCARSPQWPVRRCVRAVRRPLKSSARQVSTSACTSVRLRGNLDHWTNSSRDDMNKYYPLIARAVERLDRNADETRRAVYERARKALAQLRSNQPAFLDEDITKERLDLEEAIRKVEAEAARNSPRETCAEPRSAAPSEGKTDGDKIQSGDHGQPASPDRGDRPQAFSSRRVPILLAFASDDRDNADIQAVAIGRAYGADHYCDDVPGSRSGGSFLVMMAVLALAVPAGIFAYRGMFGGYMSSALPTIVEAGSGPNNIVRNNSDKTSVASAGSSEKLQPIDIRGSPKPVPRVISTIPISSEPGAGAVAASPSASTPGLVPAATSYLDPQVAASLPPPASAPVPIPGSPQRKETGAIAPAALEQVSSLPGLAPPVPTAESVRPPASAPLPVPASSEPTETAVSAAPTPTLGLLMTGAASVRPPASAPLPVPASSEPTETAVSAAPTPTLGLLMTGAASVPPPASAPLPVPSEPKEAAVAAPAEPTPAFGLPVLAAASVPPFGSAPLPVPTSSDSKKIQLVIVGPDEWGETDTSSPSEPTPNTAIPAAAKLNAAAAPLIGNHDVREDTSPAPSPASPRQAGRETAAEVSSRGGYAVQVASERSVAQAHASFRAIRAKFPNQLGGREPIVRRADLGAKGSYYRVMVGPFGSMEKAAGICGTLKTAGCKCLVQRI
jgi:hypothetical protein